MDCRPEMEVRTQRIQIETNPRKSLPVVTSMLLHASIRLLDNVSTCDIQLRQSFFFICSSNLVLLSQESFGNLIFKSNSRHLSALFDTDSFIILYIKVSKVTLVIQYNIYPFSINLDSLKAKLHEKRFPK